MRGETGLVFAPRGRRRRSTPSGQRTLFVDLTGGGRQNLFGNVLCRIGRWRDAGSNENASASRYHSEQCRRRAATSPGDAPCPTDYDSGRAAGFSASRIVDRFVVAVVAEQRRVAGVRAGRRFLVAAAGSTPRASTPHTAPPQGLLPAHASTTAAGTPKARY